MYSQCPEGDCVEANMDFVPDGAFSNNADWQASHGSPSVNTGTAWMWSYNSRGEGINYHSYNFVKGREYCITFTARTAVHGGGTANASANFRVFATQGDVIGIVTTSGGASIPPIPNPNQPIANENWNATNPPNTQIYTYTFTAADHFDNLWFFPSSPSLPQVELTLSKLIICDITPPPCDARFKLELNEHTETTTGVSIIPQGVPAGAVTEISIYKNGSLVYNGLPISYLASSGEYRICVTLKFRGGRECQKCFDFCIGKWSTPLLHDDIGIEVQSIREKAIIDLQFPDSLKEKASFDDVANDIQILPNPSSGIFTVQSAKGVTIKNLEVYDLMSGTLLQKTEEKAKTPQSVINLSKQKDGIYNVKITLDNGIVILKKVLVKK